MRNPKDFWSGMIYICFGVVALVVAHGYNMGTARRMGPAYFPVILGSLLIFIGTISVIRSFLIQGLPLSAFSLRKAALIVGSVLVFGLTVRSFGLLLALPLLTITSALASSRFCWVPSISMALGLTIFCSLVFIHGLGIPIPLIGSWLGR
jgi:hypothetical protein